MRFTIITRKATEEVSAIHNRMPVVLPDMESVEHWIRGSDINALVLNNLNLSIRPVGGSEQLSMQF